MTATHTHRKHRAIAHDILATTHTTDLTQGIHVNVDPMHGRELMIVTHPLFDTPKQETILRISPMNFLYFFNCTPTQRAKRLINAVLTELDLPYQVKQLMGIWYLETPSGDVLVEHVYNINIQTKELTTIFNA